MQSLPPPYNQPVPASNQSNQPNQPIPNYQAAYDGHTASASISSQPQPIMGGPQVANPSGVSFMPPIYDSGVSRGRRRYNKKSANRRSKSSVHVPPPDSTGQSQYPGHSPTPAPSYSDQVSHQARYSLNGSQVIPQTSQQQSHQGHPQPVGDGTKYYSQPESLMSSQAVTFDPQHEIISESAKSQSLLPAPFSQLSETVPTVPTGSLSDHGQTSHPPRAPLNPDYYHSNHHSSGRNPYSKPTGQPFVQNYAQTRNELTSRSPQPNVANQHPSHSSANKSTPMNTSVHSISDAGSPIRKSGGEYGLPHIPEVTGGNNNEVIIPEELSICIGSQNL